MGKRIEGLRAELQPELDMVQDKVLGDLQGRVDGSGPKRGEPGRAEATDSVTGALAGNAAGAKIQGRIGEILAETASLASAPAHLQKPREELTSVLGRTGLPVFGIAASECKAGWEAAVANTVGDFVEFGGSSRTKVDEILGARRNKKAELADTKAVCERLREAKERATASEADSQSQSHAHCLLMVHPPKGPAAGKILEEAVAAPHNISFPARH